MESSDSKLEKQTTKNLMIKAFKWKVIPVHTLEKPNVGHMEKRLQIH